MLILDTDHMSAIGRGSEPAKSLRDRLRNAVDAKVTSIVTAEKLMRGRLAQTAKARSTAAQVQAYAKLHDTIGDLHDWTLLPFDAAAVETFESLRARRLGIATMDLRIAGIAIASNATLLSRNPRDFARVPGLTVEDWLQ